MSCCPTCPKGVAGLLLRLSFGLSLLLVGAGTAWAGCPDGQVLKKIGVATDDGNITTQGQEVSAVTIDCSGTACTGALYNGDTLGLTANADLVFEGGAAADGTLFVDLTDSPLWFSEGVTFVDDANVSAIVVYSCQPR